jgi:hypothetical protein
VKTGDDSYTILANVSFQMFAVGETAKNGETRKRSQYRFCRLLGHLVGYDGGFYGYA